jgi:hypothetical protein
MATVIVNHNDYPKHVTVNHGASYVSLVIREFESGKESVVILSPEQCAAIGLDLIQHGAALAAEKKLKGALT